MQRQNRMLYLLAVLFLFMPSLAHASATKMPPEKLSWYLSLAGGINQVDKMKIFSGLEMEFKDGYFLSMAGGREYRYGRLEVEGTLSGNDLDRLTFSGTTIGTSGDVSTASLMFNGYLVWRNTTRFLPYIGIGFGLTRLAFNDIRDQNGTIILDDSNVISGAQAMLGVDYRVSNRVEAGLRFQGQGLYDIKFYNKVTGESHKEDYDSFAPSVALRYKF